MRKKIFIIIPIYNEEKIIGKLHLKLKKKFKNLITILVPRHINRSEDIKQELRKLKLIVTERSSGHKPSNDCDVYIVNTYGEMSKFLRLSNVTFIGGSLVNHGGQNPLEAVRMGNYVMHGKKVNNFKEIYNFLIERYGDFILLNPSFKLNTFLLWFLPIIFTLIGIYIIFIHNKKSKQN